MTEQNKKVNMEFTIQVNAVGNFTDDDLKNYLLFSMGFGGCSQDNPFIDDDSDAEILDIDFI